MDYDQLVECLESAKSDTRCDAVREWLQQAGFRLKKGRKGNHYSFTHPAIRMFHGGSFDCGHGRNPQIKWIPYIQNILRNVRQYEAELKKYFEGEQK